MSWTTGFRADYDGVRCLAGDRVVAFTTERRLLRSLPPYSEWKRVSFAADEATYVRTAVADERGMPRPSGTLPGKPNTKERGRGIIVPETLNPESIVTRLVPAARAVDRKVCCIMCTSLYLTIAAVIHQTNVVRCGSSCRSCYALCSFNFSYTQVVRYTVKLLRTHYCARGAILLSLHSC